MIRLLATAFLFGICFLLGLQQQNDTSKSVMAVSMRHANKAAFTERQASTAKTASTVTAVAVTTDMIAPKNNNEQCLSVADSNLATAPAIVLKRCRGLADQTWTYRSGPSQWQLALDPSYCLATVNNAPTVSGRLTVRPCTDSRALTLLPNPMLTASYQISGTTYVLDSGVFGYVGLAWQNGWSYQYWHWFQEDLAVVHTEGCQIDYALLATDSQTYEHELVCDRVAKTQSP